MSEFDGLVAIVTGGSSGIGAATARGLADRGATVAVIDRDPGRDDSVAYFACDVSDAGSVETAIAAIAARFGGIDILVNNAGVGAVGDVTANDDAEWARVFDINVFGLVRVSRAAMPYLARSASASIVNTCSIVARIGVPQRALYSATKGAVQSLTLAMAADHVASGIRVNAVLPGTADTPWVARLLDASADVQQARHDLTHRQPMGRLVTADEVANAILYLAGPMAGSTTGTLLTVDGGMGGIRIPEAAH
jgi:2-keto-3-deoxy-L-fuconate dehydrogenase